MLEAIAPSTTAGIEAYLASGLVRGIGPAIAQKIVAEFGERTLHVIEHEPERLQQRPPDGPPSPSVPGNPRVVHEGGELLPVQVSGPIDLV